MVGSNIKAQHGDLGPSKGGVGGKRATLADLATSEGLLPQAVLFHWSSAWICTTNNPGGVAGSSVSLWNGDDTISMAGIGAGQAKVTPNPAQPIKFGHLDVAHIITPYVGVASGDYYDINVLTGSAAGISTTYEITWRRSGGAAITGKNITFLWMTIAPRRALADAATGSDLWMDWAKQALSGGAHTGAVPVSPQ